MNLKNILWVRNTGEIVPNAPLADNLFGLKLSGGDIITTATGNPVSIVTNKAQNAISTLLSYSPKQSGTGDPSPQNIRPIEGWTEANLGVNSETPTTTISLGGTYYGFSIDLERGVLRYDRVSTLFDGSNDEEWKIETVSIGKNFYIDVPTAKPRQAIATGVVPMCNIMRPCTTIQVEAGRFYISNGRKLNATPGSLSTAQTIEEWRTWLSSNNMQVVFWLATPIELPLTPQTVALLSGTNTIWCDGDSVEITYKAKKA